MFNETEAQERRYLEQVLDQLGAAQSQLEEVIASYSDQVLEAKQFIWENKLDKGELAASRVAATEEISQGENALLELHRLKKLIASPYFGRIDFTEEGHPGPLPYYIGIHSFCDPKTLENIIYDWRAPISSMFYDFETGPAFFKAPGGVISGEISRKRQYRIQRSVMEYMIESAVNINDDVLQKELSRASDEKMKNIVATIQKEQNAIIRNEDDRVLILQGAAGSGKTSIALHRVAFLLYRFKTVLNSRNVLILSPNKVFGSYISNVLPELGEENILEMGFEEVARELLGRKQKFETFAQQVETLLAGEDPEMTRRIQYKATVDFVRELDEFLAQVERDAFVPEDLEAAGMFVSAGQLKSHYRSLSRLPIRQRLQKMGQDLQARYKRERDEAMPTADARAMKAKIKAMFPYTSALQLYQAFYQTGDRSGLYRPKGRGCLEYCDVFPLLYVKLFYEGRDMAYRTIRHLLVDEMQDYTPIQYAVLSKLFDCRMTILGDSHQSVNPYSSSSAEKIRPFFPDCRCMELHKSYRSTIKITRFSLCIQPNPDLVPIERHGALPQLFPCPDPDSQLETICRLIEEYRQSAFTSLGIICRSQPQAEALYEQLRERYPQLSLLSFTSREFREGMVIACSHMAKGLEFDQVIVPDAGAEQFSTPLEQSLLYIACTRAMHHLDLTCVGQPAPILKQALQAASQAQ